jgi:hypothetical protein
MIVKNKYTDDTGNEYLGVVSELRHDYYYYCSTVGSYRHSMARPLGLRMVEMCLQIWRLAANILNN